MMNIMIASESRANQATEAFGLNLDSDTVPGDYNSAIKPNQSLTVLFKPLSGLLNQNKMLPIRYAPITIELELVDTVTDPIIDPTGSPTLGGFTFTPAATSSNWFINNVQVKVDVCTLDNALDNSYAQHLLQGKSLPISYNTFVSQLQTISGQDAPLVNVSRALTRLKSVFVTLHKDIGVVWPSNRKFWNTLFSPRGTDNGTNLIHNSEGEFEYQLQIGSKLFPEYPIRSHNESYYQLAKTLGVQASALHNFDIAAREYRFSKFVLGIDCEKVLDAGFTGINIRAGDLMSIKLKYASSGLSSVRLADRLHIILHSDPI